MDDKPVIGDICVLRRTRIVVRVVEIKPPKNMRDNGNVALCDVLECDPKYECSKQGYFYLDEMVTINQLCDEYSDFMTFTASVMNIAPRYEPQTKKSAVWRFWNLGRQARLHMLRWNVKEQLD